MLCWFYCNKQVVGILSGVTVSFLVFFKVGSEVLNIRSTKAISEVLCMVVAPCSASCD